MMNKTIKQVIDTDYKNYSIYVLENRAIPSCIDGLKPVHRKVLYSMLNEHKGKKTKVADLGSISKYNYHHAEASAMGAVVTLSAPWNNNIPLFNSHGNFGSRLVQEPAAARYIFASLNEKFYSYFKHFEVCDKHRDEDNPEPQTYLPMIPWVLVNGIEGIAVGFACRFLPHKPTDLVEACRLAAQNKLTTEFKLIPHFPDYKGSVISEEHNKVVTQGIVNREKRNTWVITEVPWGYSREYMFNHLSKMEEDGKIVDFEDNCDDTGFNFSIKLDTAADVKCVKDPISFFKLSRSFTENYTTLDETGNLRVFENKIDLIKHFVDFRIKKYKQHIELQISNEVEHNQWLMAKYMFIEEMSNRDTSKLSKKDLETIASEFTTDSGQISKLIRIPIYEFCSDSLKELSALRKKSDAEIVRLSKLDAKKEYLKDLNDVN